MRDILDVPKNNPYSSVSGWFNAEIAYYVANELALSYPNQVEIEAMLNHMGLKLSSVAEANRAAKEMKYSLSKIFMSSNGD